MTEEERPEAKEREACFAAIREIVQDISRLMDAAYQQYSRLVEQVLNGRITEEREIERKLKYDHWFCGHWHIDKHIDRMHFLFHSVEAAPQLLTGGETL